MSRSLVSGAVTSLAVHALAVAVFLSIRAPTFDAPPWVPPIEVHLLDTSAGATEISPTITAALPSVRAARAQQDAAKASIQHAAAAQATSAGSSTAGSGTALDDGVESRWRVAARGRDPVANRPLKPDCSISNPDYIWPHHDAFCKRERHAE